MTDSIISAVKREKIVVIVRGVKSEKLIPLASALYDGGIRLLEITFSADGNIPDCKTADNIKALCRHFGDKMHIGAGTVLSTNQVELTKNAGGKFIISPDTNPEVIKATKRAELVSMPGALTPSEAVLAKNSGADFVKLFPAENLGPNYIKALRAPLSHIDFLAVGGINENNMQEYLRSGVCGFGVGSNITPKEAINCNNFAEITALAKKYVSVIEKWQTI